MYQLSIQDPRKLRAEAFTRTPAGEEARILLEGATLHPGFADRLPRTTKLTPMASLAGTMQYPDGLNMYHIVVRGYSLVEFEAIVRAYLDCNFEEYERLVDALRPKQAGFPD